jgi:hypothetical protein
MSILTLGSQIMDESKKGRKKRVNWEALKQEYITMLSIPNKTALAEKYTTRIETICRKATKENWNFLRDRFFAKTQEKKVEQISDEISITSAAWDDSCMAAAKTLLEKALAELSAGGKVYSVASAIQIAQNVGKNALGEGSLNPVAVFAEAISKALEK